MNVIDFLKGVSREYWKIRAARRRAHPENASERFVGVALLAIFSIPFGVVVFVAKLAGYSYSYLSAPLYALAYLVLFAILMGLTNRTPLSEFFYIISKAIFVYFLPLCIVYYIVIFIFG